ncbi:hypothetical protein HPB50_026323 [Hyalomma asiaticum]|uniref:Uncharacterized protein n=1 Tax=Hyalomma asiaticum TaxID=266040 RepID=A0ACB7SZ21_HYAAI|nr:hypothetical protein HPB50_026323 [Hyalomma asiaticum]
MVDRKAPADVRLRSPPFIPVAEKQGQEQYRQRGPLHPPAPLEQHEIAAAKSNVAVQVDPFSPTLQNTGARAGAMWPAAGAPVQAVATAPPPLHTIVAIPPAVIAVPAVDGEGQGALPSLELVDGGMRALGGHAAGGNDNTESAVTCVLMYMAIVIVAIAAVLVYFFRSLYADPPRMTPLDYDEYEGTQTRKKRTEPPSTTVGHEEERAATGPLRFARRDKRSSARTRSPGTQPADDGGTGGLVTGGSVSEGDLGIREDMNTTAIRVIAFSDKEQRSLVYN